MPSGGHTLTDDTLYSLTMDHTLHFFKEPEKDYSCSYSQLEHHTPQPKELLSIH